MSQNRDHQRAYCSSPVWCVSMESHGEDDAGWRLLLTRQPELSGKGGGMDEGVRILPIQYLRYLKGSLTCSKMLRHGTSGFTSHPKVCCGFLSPLKIHRLCRVWTRDPWVQWQAHYPLHHLSGTQCEKGCTSFNYLLRKLISGFNMYRLSNFKGTPSSHISQIWTCDLKMGAVLC
jgi:hypothetical protein